MAEESSNKIRIINSLLAYIKSESLDSDGIILVKEGIIRQILDRIPDDAIGKVDLSGSDSAPDIDDPKFKGWMIQQREARGWGQSELARQAGIRPEQINRYEKNQKPLNAQHRTKIRTLFLGNTDGE